MPAPSCLHELQGFIRIDTYLNKFIQGLSNLQDPPFAVTRKDIQLNLTPSFEEQVNIIKQAISFTATLRYFDIDKPVTVQVDATKTGLAAAILQDDSPNAYASKALTDTEHQWANIKCEAYAFVFRCE